MARHQDCLTAALTVQTDGNADGDEADDDGQPIQTSTRSLRHPLRRRTGRIGGQFERVNGTRPCTQCWTKALRSERSADNSVSREAECAASLAPTPLKSC